MTLNKKSVRTQDDLNEEAPIDQIENRVAAKMDKIAGSAKKAVGDGLQDKKLAREGEKLEKEADRKLRKS